MFIMAYTKKIDRVALVASARDLLESEGSGAVTLRRLAQRMDVRVSSLYHHFADKAALMRAVAEEGLTELGAALVAAHSQAHSQAGALPQRQIYAMGLAYHDWA